MEKGETTPLGGTAAPHKHPPCIGTKAAQPGPVRAVAQADRRKQAEGLQDSLKNRKKLLKKIFVKELLVKRFRIKLQINRFVKK